MLVEYKLNLNYFSVCMCVCERVRGCFSFAASLHDIDFSAKYKSNHAQSVHFKNFAYENIHNTLSYWYYNKTEHM